MGEGTAAMILAVQLIALPAVFLFWIGFLYITGKRIGVRLAVVLFGVLYLVGVWRIVSGDAASTAARLALLPYEAVLAGLLGLAYAYGWSSANRAAKVGGRVCLTGAMLLIALVALK
jgi:hypothetical protein